jgi:outer membrane beta-barrel protein
MTRAATALACAALTLAAAPRAASGSAADAFENKVKPVSGQLYTKAGKLELTAPSAGLSLNDAFFSKYLVGAKLAYHVNEYFSLAVTGSLAATSTTGSTSVCPANQGCRAASQAQLNQVPGQLKWLAGAELAFAPIYGKLNLFAEKAVHFDLSLMAGPDVVSYRDVLDPQAAAGGAAAPNATAYGLHGGIGARIFLARSIALRLEVRDVWYRVAHLSSGNWQSQLLAETGLSFFIPVARGNAP